MTDFDPSLLGTKDHWDQRYSNDLANFRENQLEGEVWFGEEPEENMVAWATAHVPPSASPNVLDVGTGNGHLLFALVEVGYDPSRLTGIDYSQRSIDLSIAISLRRQEDDEAHAYKDVTFALCDFLDPRSLVPCPIQQQTSDSVWDLILDKGTFDAMSLMEKDEEGAVPLEGYVPRVVKLLRSGGYFLITSCNFTEEELIKRIVTKGGSLEHRESIPYPKFTFGGKTGSSYATVAFQKCRA